MVIKHDIPKDAYVIVIGAMKSGTTTFFAHLTSHPGVAASHVGEPEFFSEHQGHGVHVERYDDLWDYDPDMHRYCAEASTGYTKYPGEPHVPDRMLDVGIEPRFIYLVRDPIDRIESQFNHGLLRQRPWAYDDILDPALLNVSRYYMQTQQFLLRFHDRSRYRIIDFDELVTSPQAVMDGTFRWLGLDPVAIAEDRHENKTPEPSRLELLLADIDLTAPLQLIPGSIKKRLKSFLRRRSPGRRRMVDEERERAKSYLQRDIRLFGESFEFPVGKWGF